MKTDQIATGDTADRTSVAGVAAPSLSIVVPCYNEEGAIAETVEEILALPDLTDAELIIVDDGSTDRSSAIIDDLATRHTAVRVIHHPANKGYGASLRAGIRQARSELVVVTDADGTYPNHRIPELAALAQHHDMVVGARVGANAHIPWLRRLPKDVLRRYACWLTGEQIPDLNSGLRCFRRQLVLDLWRVLPDGFSFTTTITVAALRRGLTVEFVPIDYARRTGRSKIQPIRDTARFIQLLVRTGMYFAPLRVLGPAIVLLLAAFAVSVVYDVREGNLTDKTIILLMFALNTALFALLADMIDKRLPR